MNAHRPSLENTGWFARGLAIIAACLVFMIAALVCVYAIARVYDLPVDDMLASGWAVLLTILFALYVAVPMFGRIMLYWGLPVLIGQHFCLKYRAPFAIHVAIGMLAGLIPVVFATDLFEKDELTADTLFLPTIVGLTSGAAGSIAGWCVLRLFRRRNAIPKIAPNPGAG